ncbi:hypothetical protein UFOVP1_42 [uncultured Caudovirales phage]|uniref:Uncharacterized protein n=1 Tax=uncultured Caudovirales phage TaxID=2100421 RepID=A0A6J5KHC5_9CAUD|nr:hypothetical protein UFOVP1_42 [uncultured Caudovirales phage]
MRYKTYSEALTAKLQQDTGWGIAMYKITWHPKQGSYSLKLVTKYYKPCFNVEGQELYKT